MYYKKDSEQTDNMLTYNAYLNAARSFYELKKFNEAVRMAKAANSICPQFAAPYILCLKIFDYFEQYDDLEAVIKDWDRQFLRSDTINYYRGICLTERKRFQESNRWLLQIAADREVGISDIENYADVYERIADNFKFMRNDASALAYYSKALEEEPHEMFYHLRCAERCRSLRMFDRCFAHYQTVHEMSAEMDTPRAKRYHSHSWYGMAVARMCQGRLDEAEEFFLSYEAESGLDKDDVIDHAELYIRRNQFDRCIELLEKSILEFSEKENVRRYLGNLCCFYSNENQLDKAYETFQRGVENDPEDAFLYRSMGYCYYDHDEYEKAEELLHKAIELRPENNGTMYSMLLLILSKMDDVHRPEYADYVEAATSQLLETEPSTAYDLTKQAELKRALGDYEGAIELAKKSLQYNRCFTCCFGECYDGWAELAYNYMELQDYEKAVECFEKVLQIFGHHALFESQLAEAKALAEANKS